MVQLIKATVKCLETSLLDAWGNTAGRSDTLKFASDALVDFLQRCTVSGNLERMNDNNGFVELGWEN